tara:strand:+ start:1398 stop:1715 length:318 start_codon:yes stop_codon:yes gene_type:complete
MLAEDILIKAGLDKSLWGDRIIVAEQDGGFSEHIKDLSAQWTTCACGKVDRHVEMISEAIGPMDKKLHQLGILFTEQVCEHKFKRAALILTQIEERSIELLNEAS